MTDFRTFIDVHPEFVERCMKEIRVIDVNQQTLQLFHAPDKATMLRRLDEIFRDDMQVHFAEQLTDLWNGKTAQQREQVNYALDGEPVHVQMQFSVLPGHESRWDLVLVSLTDITARKKAEAYLEYLGKHDTLTKLRNRSFFADEVQRLQRRGPMPVTVLILDLNGLKLANDGHGHAVGDSLLRRAGEVLAKAVDQPMCVARIGGDEFAVLMPASEAAAGEALAERIAEMVEVNNQYYGKPVLDFSVGAATCPAGGLLEEAISRADRDMYEVKRRYYLTQGRDRRARG